MGYLDEVAEFDALGLWSFRSVWFSRYGTLLSTTEVLVEASEAGYFADELEGVVHVSVNDTLRTRFRTTVALSSSVPRTIPLRLPLKT